MLLPLLMNLNMFGTPTPSVIVAKQVGGSGGDDERQKEYEKSEAIRKDDDEILAILKAYKWEL